jgi:hypothetical protein
MALYIVNQILERKTVLLLNKVQGKCHSRYQNGNQLRNYNVGFGYQIAKTQVWNIKHRTDRRGIVCTVFISTNWKKVRYLNIKELSKEECGEKNTGNLKWSHSTMVWADTP